MSIKEYFSNSRYVAEGQWRLYEKYRNDCLYAFYYAPVEVEAWGGEVIYTQDGPPNSGQPFIRSKADIDKIRVSEMQEKKCLLKVLDTISELKQKAEGKVPVIGVVMSPFSLPIMQMGFERYLDIFYGDEDFFNRLMAVNKDFCIRWANAQVDAGADAICYFDPFSSTTVIEPRKYEKIGFKIAREVTSSLKAPTATHFASGKSYRILDLVARTGTKIVGVSWLENLTLIKNKCYNKLTVMGNLNGIEMRKWKAEDAEHKVKKAIFRGAAGGGFILSDNHGEIPWFVEDDTLMAVRDAVDKWGRYPLEWTQNHG
ncbi:MAG: uroporphyrinogen decarboxylase family protein [Actinomycetota bacterium]